jgi:hypothetical protein
MSEELLWEFSSLIAMLVELRDLVDEVIVTAGRVFTRLNNGDRDVTRDLEEVVLKLRGAEAATSSLRGVFEEFKSILVGSSA